MSDMFPHEPPAYMRSDVDPILVLFFKVIVTANLEFCSGGPGPSIVI